MNVSMIKKGIDAFLDHGLEVPVGLRAWCIENGRGDLLASESNESLPSMRDILDVAPDITRESGELDTADEDLQAARELAKLLGVELPKDYKPKPGPKIAFGEDVDPLDAEMFSKIQAAIKKNVGLIYGIDLDETKE